MPRQVSHSSAAYHQNHRPRESNFKSSRVRLPAIKYGSHDDDCCSHCWSCKCCNSSILLRKRLAHLIFKAAVVGALLLLIHYFVVYGGVNIELLKFPLYSHNTNIPSNEPAAVEINVDSTEQFQSIPTAPIIKPNHNQAHATMNIEDFKNIETLSLRLNVSIDSFSDDYIFSENKVKYLRFQDEMDVYWKSPLPLHEVKGVVFLFHNCKYNGQEWWSLLRDDITFEHYRFQYSLPSEIRIATGFLQAGYWVVALTPVKNQYKNGCWVKDDRMYIPAVAEYLRTLRILSYLQSDMISSSSKRPSTSLSSLTSLFTQPSHLLSQPKQGKPSVTLPPALSFFALGITNGGAFLTQHLKYWLNPIPPTPPPTHPHPHQSPKGNDVKSPHLEETHGAHHGFAGRRHSNTHLQPHQSHSSLPSTKNKVHPSRRLNASPLTSFLLATQPLAIAYPPVQFTAIILMNAGMWHRDYFPSSNNNNKDSDKNSEEWAVLPPIFFVDYTRNGDVAWHNTQTMHQLLALSETRDTLLSAKSPTTSRTTPFAKQVLSDPLPLYPAYFSDHVSVLYPPDITVYPTHRVQFHTTHTTITPSPTISNNNPFGADTSQRPLPTHHINATVSQSTHQNHKFTLPSSAVFTPDDSTHLFFALYFGDYLQRDEVKRLHNAYQRHLEYRQTPTSSGNRTDDHWLNVVSETVATHHRDGVERFIWPGSNILFKDVAGHIHLPRTVKLCQRSVQSSFFKECDLLHELDTKRQDHGIHSPILQALRKAWGWRETNDEHVSEMVMWFNEHLRFANGETTEK